MPPKSVNLQQICGSWIPLDDTSASEERDDADLWFMQALISGKAITEFDRAEI